MTVLALDPSLRATGWALAEPEGRKLLPREWGCIRTAPVAKRRGVLEADADVADLATICAHLEQHLGGVTRLVVELTPAGARSHRAARCAGLVTGLVAGLARARGLPVSWLEPERIRTALGIRPVKGCGIKDAVALVVETRWPGLDPVQPTGVETEAVVDALAVLAAAEVLG